MFLTLSNSVKRRLRDINMTFLNKRSHKTEEESKQKRTDMLTVDVGIRHNNYFSVSELFYIEILADSRSQSGNYGSELIVSIDSVESCFLDIQHFTPKRKYRLNPSVASALSRTSRRISLDDKNLGFRAVLGLAVR